MATIWKAEEDRLVRELLSFQTVTDPTPEQVRDAYGSGGICDQIAAHRAIASAEERQYHAAYECRSPGTCAWPTIPVDETKN